MPELDNASDNISICRKLTVVRVPTGMVDSSWLILKAVLAISENPSTWRPVITSQTNKSSHFREILRFRPFRDSRQLVGIRFDSFFGNQAPQEFHSKLE